MSEEAFGPEVNAAFWVAILKQREQIMACAIKAELTGGERVQLHPRHIINHIKALEP